MFWQKKKWSNHDELLLKRIIGLEADVERIRAVMDSLNTNMCSLRGLVNRKISGKDPVLDDDTSNTGISDGFDELRKLNKESSSS